MRNTREIHEKYKKDTRMIMCYVLYNTIDTQVYDCIQGMGAVLGKISLSGTRDVLSVNSTGLVLDPY